MTQFIADKAGNTEAQQKQARSYLFAQDSTGLATDGVLSGLAVSQTTTASASVNVSAGACNVQDSAGNGVSECVSNTQEALDVLGANPMGGTPRNDLIVFDSATVSGGTGGLRVVVGTPNAVPSDPTVPATAVALARIRNLASATTVPAAQIDDLRRYTSLKQSTKWGFEAAVQTSPQTVPASTITAVRWNAPSENVGGFVVSGFTATVPTGLGGLYAISAAVSVGNTQATRAYIDLYSNASRIAVRTPFTGDSRGGISQTVRLSAGDQLKVEVYCATATTVNGGFLAAYRIGD